MFNNIHNRLINNLSGILTVYGFYTNTGTVNQEDLAKATYPLHNIYAYPDNNLTTSNMNQDRYISRWEIKSYDKLPYESSNAHFEIDYYLTRLLDDIKRMISLDFTLSGLTQGIYYITSRRMIYNLSDLMMPKYLSTTIEIPYSLYKC